MIDFLVNHAWQTNIINFDNVLYGIYEEKKNTKYFNDLYPLLMF